MVKIIEEVDTDDFDFQYIRSINDNDEPYTMLQMLQNANESIRERENFVRCSSESVKNLEKYIAAVSKEKIALELANAALQAQVAVLKEIISGAL